MLTIVTHLHGYTEEPYLCPVQSNARSSNIKKNSTAAYVLLLYAYFSANVAADAATAVDVVQSWDFHDDSMHSHIKAYAPLLQEPATFVVSYHTSCLFYIRFRFRPSLTARALHVNKMLNALDMNSYYDKERKRVAGFFLLFLLMKIWFPLDLCVYCIFTFDCAFLFFSVSDVFPS